ncbi:MAG: hypothetical protein ACRCSZ_09570, partial [Lactococcus lactis]
VSYSRYRYSFRVRSSIYAGDSQETGCKDNWSFYLFVLWFVEKNKRLESKDYGKSKSGQAQP